MLRTPRLDSLRGLEGLFLLRLAWRFKVDETAFHLGASRFDLFSGKEIVQRIFQIGMAGVLLLGSVTEPIINGATIKQLPGLRFDAEGFRGSGCTD